MNKSDAHIALDYQEPKLNPAPVTNVDELQDALIRLGYKPGSGSSGYSGHVGSSGTAGTPFPAGWSATSGSTGQYTITHNLGTTSYAVVCTGIGSVGIPSIQSIGANSFTVWFYSLAGSNTALGFEFVLIPQ